MTPIYPVSPPKTSRKRGFFPQKGSENRDFGPFSPKTRGKMGIFPGLPPKTGRGRGVRRLRPPFTRFRPPKLVRKRDFFPQKRDEKGDFCPSGPQKGGGKRGFPRFSPQKRGGKGVLCRFYPKKGVFRWFGPQIWRKKPNFSLKNAAEKGIFPPPPSPPRPKMGTLTPF